MASPPPSSESPASDAPLQAAPPEEVAWRRGEWSLSGTVSDRLGRGVPGASVVVASEEKGNATLAAVTSTDAVGFYTIRSLSADGGAFTIGVVADRFASNRTRLVPAGHSVRHDVTLEALRSLTITLKGDDGRPWRGPVECRLTRVAGSTQGTSFDRQVTDASGRVQLADGLREDDRLATIRLEVRVADRVPAIVSSLAPYARPDGDVEVELALSRGATFQGLVVEADGAPAAAADVWITPESAPEWFSPLAAVRTDATGRFATAGLADGRYLAFSRSSRGILAAPALVVITAGAPTDAQLLLSDRTGTITGTVVRPDGTPVADLSLELHPSIRLSGVHDRSARTDAAGRFTVAGLSLDSPGYWLIVAATCQVEVQTPAATADRVELRLVATFPDPSFHGQSMAPSLHVQFAR